MHTYEPKTFTIPQLDGISAKSVEEHLGLYQGYVKNYNEMTARIGECAKDPDAHAHELSELLRRRSFEFDGMRLHELYFSQFEDGASEMPSSGPLVEYVSKTYGSMEKLVALMKRIAGIRGPGWAILYIDPASRGLVTGFSGEQHMGHFVTLPILLALDVWEHAYILDYGASGKARYVDAFFKNLNWSVVERRFLAAPAQ